MRVLIISPCILPVPAVKGGAVQTLIESIIRQNEVNQFMDLTVVSSYNDKAQQASCKYKNTKFIFLRENGILEKLDSFIDYGVNRIKNSDEQAHHYLWKCCVISKLKKILWENDYDKVVFQNSGYLLNVLKDEKICNKYNGKLYYHLHNDIPSSVYKKGAENCRLLLISDYLSIEIRKLLGEKVNNQMNVVKNGIRTDLFCKSLSSKEKDDLKSELNIGLEKKVIVYAGRITEYKGVKELIEAFNLLNNKNYVLLIIGSFNFASNQKSNFENTIYDLVNKSNGQICCTGYIPYQDIWKYYQLGDVAVLPSIWNEPAGLTMLEAALCKIPVITTNAGGIPEYLNNDYSIQLDRNESIVEAIAQSIDSVLCNQQEWSYIADKASAYVASNYSEEAFYDRFYNVLLETNEGV